MTAAEPATAVWSRDVVDDTGPHGPVRKYAARPASLPRLLEASAARWGSRVHLVHGSRRLTFDQHRGAVLAAARWLRAAGVRPGDRIGIFAANSPEWVAALWACWEVGAIAAPLNWSWTAEQVRVALEDCEPVLVLADTDRWDRVPDGLARPIEAVVDGPTDGADGVGSDERTEDEPALIIFTSGTTGRPKGATFTQGAIIASAQGAIVLSGRLPHEIPDDARLPVGLLSYPTFHISGTMNVVISTAVGGRLVFHGHRFDPEQVLDLIELERVNAWGAVPTMVQRVIDAQREQPRDASSLRNVTMGGAPMPAGLAERLAETFPSVRRRVTNAYGMTETTGTFALCSGDEAVEDPTCVGAPMPVVQVAIDAGEGAPGEIMVRTPTMMLGYWGRSDSPIDDDGWLRTGDVGVLDDRGRLHIVDRIKDIIIRGGENISPAAVEAALCSHPSVLEAAVFAVPDPDFGEAVGAIVVAAAEVTAEDLAAHSSTTLARFEVPQHWWLRADPLPRGTLDKVLRREARDEFLRHQAETAEG